MSHVRTLIVVHCESVLQAIRNASIAIDNGADGVFLINHAVSADELLRCAAAVRVGMPSAWIGLNFLDIEPREALHKLASAPFRVDGLWVDSAGVCDDDDAPAREFAAALAASSWKGMYFGGVAFKYQRQPHDLVRTAERARSLMDVITTSGPGTGSAVSVEKLDAVFNGAAPACVAVASGVSVDNLHELAGRASAVLLNTSVSKSFTELDADRVARFVALARSTPALRPLELRVQANHSSGHRHAEASPATTRPTWVQPAAAADPNTGLPAAVLEAIAGASGGFWTEPTDACPHVARSACLGRDPALTPAAVGTLSAAGAAGGSQSAIEVGDGGGCPPRWADFFGRACSRCSEHVNTWVCLACAQVFCGRCVAAASPRRTHSRNVP